MTSKKRINEFYKNEPRFESSKGLPLSVEKITQFSRKLSTEIESANSVFVHFDHIQGESEIDRYQIFSNLLKAAVFLGLNVDKIDFHRKDA